MDDMQSCSCIPLWTAERLLNAVVTATFVSEEEIVETILKASRCTLCGFASFFFLLTVQSGTAAELQLTSSKLMRAQHWCYVVDF